MKNRKTVRHFEDARHLHELTFSCDRRMPLLTDDGWRKILATSLNKACIERHFALIAFVFMRAADQELPGRTTGRSRVAADFISRRALAPVFDGNRKSAARLMPEHVHLLVLPLNSNVRISRLLARLKQSTLNQKLAML